MKKILIVILLVASFLRLYKITVNPPSLFGDELDLGYQAYSILKTGRDYQGNFMPIHFHSIAEWRTPLYLYSSVPTVAVFGITPLGVRLPAAIFGILGVWAFYLLIRKLTGKESLALFSSAFLAISPWHLQYSRAGFEVTEMLFFLIIGIYVFFVSLEKPKWLWISLVSLILTVWTYSTAKLFTPLLIVFLFGTNWRKILSFPKKYLIYTTLAGLIVGLPIALSTLFGGGSARFDYLSVFSDPVTETEVGTAREVDARVRGEGGFGLTPSLGDRIIHNKYTFWGKNIATNYLSAFSTEFLFIKGDINLRHSIGIGEFYKPEIILLIIGLILFFTSKDFDKKTKLLFAFWILAGPIPSAITRDGGSHATRLILILPPLIFLISYGFWSIRNKKILVSGYFVLFLIAFISYIHQYYVHYPRDSERWWHYGWQEAIQTTKSIQVNYDRIVISMDGEPAWIFFAGWYQYPPNEWQKNFPIGHDEDVPGFGKISTIGKFHFGSPKQGLYEWGKIIDKKTLYVANASEVKINLILEPDRTPKDLTLIKSIAYPSGEPSMYIFSGK